MLASQLSFKIEMERMNTESGKKGKMTGGRKKTWNNFLSGKSQKSATVSSTDSQTQP